MFGLISYYYYFFLISASKLACVLYYIFPLTHCNVSWEDFMRNLFIYLNLRKCYMFNFFFKKRENLNNLMMWRMWLNLNVDIFIIK